MRSLETNNQRILDFMSPYVDFPAVDAQLSLV